MKTADTQTQTTERQADKEWLLSDLRERLDAAYLRLPRKVGFMRQVTEEGIARFQRLIAMVQETPE